MTTSSYTTITRSNSVPDIHNHLLNIVSNTPTTTTTTTITTLKSQQQSSTHTNTSTVSLSAMITPPSTALITTTTTLQTNPLTNSFSNSRDCISNATDDEDDDDESNESNIDLATKTIRRHSSQSLILNTNTNTNNGSNNNNTTERICSSPINALKMSTRVCQIKIDEGIEPHLNREIKSEREMQNTLKLKSSYDELVLDKINDDQQTTSSSSSSSSKFRRYRTCSDSLHNTTLPSPSQLSPSYSNSTSPTSCIGLLRCNSPLITAAQPSTNQLNNSNSTITNNYFSPCPSPTTKLFGNGTSRRSMSPINKLNSQPVKRKFSDVDSDSTTITASQNLITSYSPKRFLSSDNSSNESNNSNSNTNNSTINNKINNNNNNSSNQFAYPLVINTSLTSNNSTVNSNNNINNSTINTSITSSNNTTNNNNNNNNFQYPSPLNDINKLSNENNSNNNGNNNNNNNGGINNSSGGGGSSKYTFMPIQLPQTQSAQKLLRPNNINIINITNSINSSPIDSPARCCDSPSSYSSVSLMSACEKPDSGYQSSVQNNSDSESCI